MIEECSQNLGFYVGVATPLQEVRLSRSGRV